MTAAPTETTTYMASSIATGTKAMKGRPTFSSCAGAPDVPPNGIRKRPLSLRAVTTRGRRKESAYALSHTGELLSVLEQFFGIEYPYDKLDFIAVPGMNGAMEYPGAITFLDTWVLFDQGSRAQKQEYALVMAHQLAHQWVGNLVTTAWWNDVWLSEALATWVATIAVETWDHPLMVGADAPPVEEMVRMMKWDATEAARPIRLPSCSGREAWRIPAYCPTCTGKVAYAVCGATGSYDFCSCEVLCSNVAGSSVGEAGSDACIRSHPTDARVPADVEADSSGHD
jgi:hypothetical protein